MPETLQLEIASRLTKLSPIPTQLEPRLRVPKPIRAVLFDIYGTLLISSSGDISYARLKSDSGSIGHKTNIKIRELLEDCNYKTSKRLSAHLVSRTLRQKITERHRQLHTEGIEHPEVDIRNIWGKTLESLWEDRLLLEPPPPLFY